MAHRCRCGDTVAVRPSPAQQRRAGALNPNTGGWSPVVITVPYVSAGTSLTINLTNSLSFANGNTVPTSITIVGQIGGGLGGAPTTTPSPTHGTQQVTWPTAGSGPTFTPPPQGPRVQSFATEVAAGATSALTWAISPPRHVSDRVRYASLDPRSDGVIRHSRRHHGADGAADRVPIIETAPGCAYLAFPGSTTAACAVPYDAEVPILLSEIDPVQNNEVSTAVNLPGFSETTVWSGQPGGCGNPATTNSGNCYPPAVNYMPLYYMVNGVAFDKTHAANSLFPVSPAAVAPAAGTGWIGLGPRGQCGLAHARAGDRRRAGRGPNRGDQSSGDRFQSHGRGRQRAAGTSEGQDRRIHGGGQGL